MTIQHWPSNVNTRAYGQDSSYKENRDELEFKSGRRVYYLKTSTARKTHSVSLKFDDEIIVSGGKTEFGLFLNFFETTIKSGTVPFYFPDVTIRDGATVRAYTMSETPTWSGQKVKEVTLTLEEY